MSERRKCLLVGCIGALLLGAAPQARAQDNSSAGAPAPAPTPPPATAAPPVRDFRLPGRTIVPQPQQQPPPVIVAPPSPVADAPPAARPQASAPARSAPQRQAPAPAPIGQAAPVPDAAPPAAPAPAETPLAPAPAAPARPQGEDFPWLYLAPVPVLALLAFALLRRRRRRREIEEAAAAEPEAAPAPALKPEPLLRPWLELELKVERASATTSETVVQFELAIANTGKAPARNLRIDVKMFNAGREQDKEIGAFFRTASRESTKCQLPGIAAEMTGVIRGQVTMQRDDMRAVKLEDKLLFIPVIAVNALYDWGDGRTGQTSKSYVVGRELEQPSEKMGAFRVDQGPRIWRTIGQRQHKLARRV